MPTKTADEIIASIADGVREEFLSRVGDLGLESPIERILAAAFEYYFAIDPCWPGNVWSLRGTTLEWCREPIPIDIPRVSIYSQVPAGSYWIDFVVRYQSNGTVFVIAVECDGHEFHERTKEQAEHDKRRDRYLQSLGLTVLHFTGSEIWREAIECARSVLDLLQERVYAHDEAARQQEEKVGK
jgi:very-short-patch-repair endonuclease